MFVLRGKGGVYEGHWLGLGLYFLGEGIGIMGVFLRFFLL